MRCTTIVHTAVLVGLLLGFGRHADAQFGGKPGDAVIYTVTYNGSDVLQVSPLGTLNTAANLAGFKKVPLDTVGYSDASPFPILRQVLYSSDRETFQVGTDPETTPGLHRIFTQPTKLFVSAGLNLPFTKLLGQQNTFISFPAGLDLEKDLALEALSVLTWFPAPWPMIVLTETRGPVGDPNISGFQALFSLPDAVKLPALIPWVNMSTLYPGAGWKAGVDLKLLEQDTRVGSTVRLMKMRPGTQTPSFRTAGHNHMFILQGSVTVTPAGGAPIVMNKNDYVFVPQNFTVTIANPAAYTGPVRK